MSLPQKLDLINQKIASLQHEQQKIHDTLAQEFVAAFRQTQAFTVDFPTLMGGVLDVIRKAQSGGSEVEVWQKAGLTFLKSLARSKSGKDQGSSKKVAQNDAGH